MPSHSAAQTVVGPLAQASSVCWGRRFGCVPVWPSQSCSVQGSLASDKSGDNIQVPHRQEGMIGVSKDSHACAALPGAYPASGPGEPQSHSFRRYSFITLFTSSAFAPVNHNLGGVEAEGRYSVVFPLQAAMPNPRLTPGATNPAITPDNLDETICRSGRSHQVYPSTSGVHGKAQEGADP